MRQCSNPAKNHGIDDMVILTQAPPFRILRTGMQRDETVVELAAMPSFRVAAATAANSNAAWPTGLCFPFSLSS